MTKSETSCSSFVKGDLIKHASRLKGKFTSISEKVGGEAKTLSIKQVYKLDEKSKPFLVIIVKNYNKTPKFRYFVAKVLANQSSDFLVKLVQNFSRKHQIKLLQYSLFPKLNRNSLISLIEFSSEATYIESKSLLEELDKFFSQRITDFLSLLNS